MNKKIILGIIIGLLVVAGVTYYFSRTGGVLCWPYCPGMTDQDREEIKESAFESEISSEQKALTVSQEVIKGISRAGIPAFNVFVFDSNDFVAKAFPIN
jgi:hypothetical protein